jgi:hypothetical protein
MVLLSLFQREYTSYIYLYKTNHLQFLQGEWEKIVKNCVLR